MRRLKALLGLAVAAGLGATCAGLGVAKAADEGILTGTLKTIKDRGTILIGYREKSAPFAYTNKGGQPIGFSVDICHGIAEGVANRLNTELVESDAPSWQKGVRIVYVPVASDARLPKVISGAIDLECGSTTANAERGKTVAFSPIFFLAGTKILAAIAPANGKVISSYRDLAGRKIGVATGTTTEDVVKRLASKSSPPIAVVEQPAVDDAYSFLVAGAVDAIASDDILLTGLVATRPDGGKYAVVGDYLSFEPYAIMFRKDDPDFADVVRTSFESMAADNYLSGRYRRWFQDRLPGGENLNLPMSSQLSEMYRSMGQTD